ncbi:hypothetical protein WG66_012211 [Moniliophthora roreri]|uniref:ER membrane protein complex subunit 10 n=1 Tax=Moniliophthora roreri TaxID=221103 RepID=A0A0W0EZD6_MONRR|nr:hypothetical protein WG66_012211 [Moniliophthora roreri]
MFVLLSCLLLPLVVLSREVNLYHRLHLPNGPQSAFTERGTINFDESRSNLPVTFQSSVSSQEHLGQFAETLQQIPEGDRDRVLYQVALERDSINWDISSVKWCHVPSASSESIILHITDLAHASSPYAVDYFISPTPHDGACPSSSSMTNLNSLAILNITVSLRTPRLPPLPELKTPPPLTPKGEPVKPEPEKSFLQKYWMYILAAVVALMMSGGPPEEAAAAAGGQK